MVQFLLQPMHPSLFKMHKELLPKANEDTLRDFINDVLDMLASTNHHLYESLEDDLYCRMYGSHFNENTLTKAVDLLGTRSGASWTVEQTNQVAANHNINFDKFNQFDFNYIMNYFKQTYSGLINNDAAFIAKLTIRFLEAPEGKAYNFYKLTKNG